MDAILFLDRDRHFRIKITQSQSLVPRESFKRNIFFFEDVFCEKILFFHASIFENKKSALRNVSSGTLPYLLQSFPKYFSEALSIIALGPGCFGSFEIFSWIKVWDSLVFWLAFYYRGLVGWVVCLHIQDDFYNYAVLVL